MQLTLNLEMVIGGEDEQHYCHQSNTSMDGVSVKEKFPIRVPPVGEISPVVCVHIQRRYMQQKTERKKWGNSIVRGERGAPGKDLRSSKIL